MKLKENFKLGDVRLLFLNFVELWVKYSNEPKRVGIEEIYVEEIEKLTTP